MNLLHYRMNKNLNSNNKTNSTIQTNQIQQRKGPTEKVKDNATPLFSESTEEETTAEVTKVCT